MSDSDEDIHHTDRLCRHKDDKTKKMALKHIFYHPMAPKTNFCFHEREYNHSPLLHINKGWKEVTLNDTRFTYIIQVSPKFYKENDKNALFLKLIILKIEKSREIEEVWNEYCYKNNVVYSQKIQILSAIKYFKYNKTKRNQLAHNIRLISIYLRNTVKPMLPHIRSRFRQEAGRLIGETIRKVDERYQQVAGLRSFLLGTKLSVHFACCVH